MKPGFSRSRDDYWTTEPEYEGGGGMGHRLNFKYACNGLVQAVRNACQPTDSLVNECFREAEAVWYARYVVREAKRLGLIPSEPPEVRVLIELDVDAGEPVR